MAAAGAHQTLQTTIGGAHGRVQGEARCACLCWRLGSQRSKGWQAHCARTVRCGIHFPLYVSFVRHSITRIMSNEASYLVSCSNCHGPDAAVGRTSGMCCKGIHLVECKRGAVLPARSIDCPVRERHRAPGEIGWQRSYAASFSYCRGRGLRAVTGPYHAQATSSSKQGQHCDMWSSNRSRPLAAMRCFCFQLPCSVIFATVFSLTTSDFLIA